MIGALVNSTSLGNEAVNNGNGRATINLDDKVANNTILLNNIVSNLSLFSLLKDVIGLYSLLSIVSDSNPASFYHL